ncbi:MAG: phenylalanine--tRNA ligase subunit beta, partial [Bacteroidota bacterium]
SAYFDPGRIRKASKALGLQTDASYRFERGVDPTGQARAAARAAALLAEVAGGTVVSGMVDVHPVPHEARQVTLRPSRVATVLGMEVPQNEIVRLLAAIGFQVADAEARGLDAFAEAAMREEGVAAAAAEAAGAGLVVTVPPFRPDVEREIDVIEEVARLWGFDRLPTPAATPVPLVPASDTPSARLLDRVRQRLAALGFRELYTNSLVPKATAEAFADAIWTGRDGAPVDTLNPISQEMAAMRPSLLPGLVAVAGYNQARGAGALRLFEAGRVYRQSADGSGAVDGYHEHTSLSIGMSGETPASWRGPAGETDVYDLKGVVLDVLASLGLDDIEETPRPAPEGVTAYALDLATGGARLGSLGLLAESIGDSADLSAPLFVAELDWDAIASRAESAPPTYQTISRFPVAERDLAVVVPTSQPAGPLLRTIRKAGGPLLQDVRLFDLYTGDNVGDDEKSLAFGLTFGADRTLRDKEIDGRVRRIVKALDAQHGAVLRG